MYMHTQTHTNTLFSDQRPDDSMAYTHTKWENFASPKLELNYLLTFLSASMPSMHKHTDLLGYIQCHYIQILPEHSSPSCEFHSSPALRGKEPSGPDRGITALCARGSSAHDRLRTSRNGSSGPYASFKA